MQKLNNKLEKDLATKVWLQQEAIRAIPPKLKAHAVLIDESPPPLNRPFPHFDTPPVKGFNVKDYVGKRNDDDEDDDNDDSDIDIDSKSKI
jgi:hypothetical protein